MPELELKEEKLVFKVIQEYLDKNRYFSANDIISFINSRFAKASININNTGIRVILRSLFKKNLIVEKSKLTKNDILNNSNRKEIFECIKKNPCIHFNRLTRKLNLSVAVIKWHLMMLLKFNFIRKEKIGNYNAYFIFDVNIENAKILHIISREKYRKMLEFLKINNKGHSIFQISKELGMHRNTISKYIEYLYEIGLIISEELSNKTLYFLNENSYDEIISTFR